MPSSVSKAVAQAIVLPLIVLATTLTSNPAAAASGPHASGNTGLQPGHGHAPVQSHHIASLKGLSDLGPSSTPAKGDFNQPTPAGTSAGAQSDKPGHLKGAMIPIRQSARAGSVNAPIVDAPTFAGTFTSFQQGPDGNAITPDSAIAVGPFHVLAAVNRSLKIFNRNATPDNVFNNNGTLVNFIGTSTFFAGVPNATDFLADPRLFFDSQIDRFWLATVTLHNIDITVPGDTNRSTILLAVSDNQDPTQGWSVFGIDGTVDGSTVTSNWCDYPMLGIDADEIFVSCNMYNFPSTAPTFQYAKVRVMSKSQFTNLPIKCCFWDDFTKLPGENSNNPFAASVQPAREYGASTADGEWLINAQLSCNLCTPHTLGVWHITHGPNGHMLDHNTIDVGKFPAPLPAHQPGGPNNIDTKDGRLLFAFWKGGRLSTGQTMACYNNPSDCAAFTEVDVSGGLNNLSLVNDFEGSDDGQDRIYPAADVNAVGDMTMVYTLSGPATFLSAASFSISHTLSCTSGSCLPPGEQILAPGGGDYLRLTCDPAKPGCTNPLNAWGDYFAAAADPDGTGIWVQGEFAIGPSTWATVVGLTKEPPDTTPPTTTASLGPTPVAGWNKGSVLVTLKATDAESGIQSITYSISGADNQAPITVTGAFAFFFIPTEGISTVQYQATDAWGNVEAAKFLNVQIDESPPIVSCTAPDSIWHATDQLASCTAKDTPSGLVFAADASFTLTTSVPDGTETASAFTNSRVVCDVAGNCTTAGPVGPFMIDKKPPTISITSPTNATYTLNQVVPVSYSCTDGGSGVAACTGPVPSGGNLDTSTVGVHSFTVNAIDKVGNKSTQTVTYTVSYAVCLLYDASKVHAPGAYVFLMELCDANGVDVSSSSVTVTATKIEPGHITPKSNASPSNVFFYDPSTNSYVYVLDTMGLPPNNYQLMVTASGDPTVHTLPFVLK